ncbi:MAG: hydantoinase/carbamoylase family amidase [Pseudomonadota bacterium]
MARINAQRLLADLRALASFGRVGSGVDRIALSAADIEARRWLAGRMAEAGLEALFDGVGNVYGRDAQAETTILIGSHTDSVPKGGWLDGALGVIYGLEVARALAEAEPERRRGVDVISFEDEEGAYLPLLGSLSLCGEVGDAAIAAARSQAGRRLADALAAAGLAGAARARLERSRHCAYLEAHIEQGPLLEAKGARIGVVSGIVGIRRFAVAFAGQADHAGTTPMAMRKDAGAALIGFAARLLAGFERAAGANSVWNLGNATLAPGAANVVPAAARLLVEFRDVASEALERFERVLLELVAAADGTKGVSCTAERLAAIAPAQMDGDLMRAVRDGAQRRGVAPVEMPSGAGHDAMVMARHLPTAMMFIPSIGGRSHDTAEDTAEADIVLGAEVFLAAVESALERIGGT